MKHNQSTIALNISGITSDFVMPLGASIEEKIESLQSIKDSMSDCMIAALENDCLLSDNTVTWLRSLYMEADIQIKQLQKRNTAFAAATA